MLTSPLKQKKTFGPLTTTSLAGIALDSVLIETPFPPDRLNKCFPPLMEFLHRKKAILREVQSLNGLLNFASSVRVPGRALFTEID